MGVWGERGCSPFLCCWGGVPEARGAAGTCRWSRPALLPLPAASGSGTGTSCARPGPEEREKSVQAGSHCGRDFPHSPGQFGKHAEGRRRRSSRIARGELGDTVNQGVTNTQSVTITQGVTTTEGVTVSTHLSRAISRVLPAPSVCATSHLLIATCPKAWACPCPSLPLLSTPSFACPLFPSPSSSTAKSPAVPVNTNSPPPDSAPVPLTAAWVPAESVATPGVPAPTVTACPCACACAWGRGRGSGRGRGRVEQPGEVGACLDEHVDGAQLGGPRVCVRALPESQLESWNLRHLTSGKGRALGPSGGVRHHHQKLLGGPTPLPWAPSPLCGPSPLSSLIAPLPFPHRAGDLHTRGQCRESQGAALAQATGKGWKPHLAQGTFVLLQDLV